MHYHVGHTVDEKYEILAALGEGGMGETYRARDCATGETVVLKIPHANLIGDPATFSRYQREMEIGKRLQHPNIQRLIAQGRPGGGIPPYMVLEYVPGRLLRDYLAEHAPLSVDESLRITMQLADALQYCHERGVVHRDLKPENILITGDGHVKVLDFGIALLRGARRLTFRRLSSEVGTPDYMAPEQVRGERGDARTDIYAVGIILYEMLAGEVPYQGDNALAVMSQRVTIDPPLLRRVRPEAPPQLEAVVYHALRREPADRYQSMVDLHRDLGNLDAVAIPDYGPSQLLMRPRGGLPPGIVTVGIIILVFALLITLGIVAEIIHRNLVR